MDNQIYNRCRKDYTDFIAGKIDLKELVKRMAYISLELIETYRHMPEPTKPEEVNQYFMASKDDQKKADGRGFWNTAVNNTWLRSSKMIWEKNKGNYSKLKELSLIIPKDDFPAQGKIKTVLDSFRNFVEEERRFAREHGASLINNEPEKAPQETLSDEALGIVKLFDGQIV